MSEYNLVKLFKFIIERELERNLQLPPQRQKMTARAPGICEGGIHGETLGSKGKDKEGDDLWASVQASRGISLTELKETTVVFGTEMLASLCSLLKQTYKRWAVCCLNVA